MTDLHYISKGNTKTECFSFDLPALSTCPGKTETCAKKCYAANLERAYPNVGAKYARNYEITFHPAFTDYMVETIPADCQFRIHVSGDFFHVDYIAKWIEIATRRPDVTFYAYTRSWRLDDMALSIVRLDALANVNVNLSVDDETGAPSLTGQRLCYLTDDDSVPSWIRAEDIVFRSNHIGQKRRRNNAAKKGLCANDIAPLVKRLGGRVCPKEQGQDLPKLSCAKCRLCVDKPGRFTNV